MNQTPPPQGSRTSEKDPRRQFDFLLGEWYAHGCRYAADGTVVGEYDGRWRAEVRGDGRMVVDEFTALDGAGRVLLFYVTLRTYCAALKRWEMTFLAADQPLLLRSFHGNERGGEVHLEARGLDGAGGEVLAKVRFDEITPSSFRWEQEMSTDGGCAWHRVGTIHARRAPSANGGS